MNKNPFEKSPVEKKFKKLNLFRALLPYTEQCGRAFLWLLKNEEGLFTSDGKGLGLYLHRAFLLESLPLHNGVS